MLELLVLFDVFACKIQYFISGSACYPDFEQKCIYLLASKTVKNRHRSSSNNYIWWIEFVWYLALSVYFIEIILSIMSIKRKLHMSENLSLEEICIPSNFQHRSGKKWLCEAFLNLKRIGPKVRMLWQKDICLLLEYFHHQKAYLFTLPQHGDLSQAVLLPFSSDSGFEITGSVFFKKQWGLDLNAYEVMLLVPFFHSIFLSLRNFLYVEGVGRYMRKEEYEVHV